MYHVTVAFGVRSLFPYCFYVKSMLGFTVFGRLVHRVKVITSNLVPAVFQIVQSWVVLFRASFICLKIIQKLYASIRLDYLSFGVEITFIDFMVGEIWSLFDDALALSEFWTVLNAFSFIISKV